MSSFNLYSSITKEAKVNYVLLLWYKSKISPKCHVFRGMAFRRSLARGPLSLQGLPRILALAFIASLLLLVEQLNCATLFLLWNQQTMGLSLLKLMRQNKPFSLGFGR